MVSFESDYIAGAHPEIIKRLVETNLEQLPGYGADIYTARAKEKIRAAVGIPDAEVGFIAGGTQTNAIVISTMLGDFEGVVAADTGHVSVHEAGAIEYTGHKVLTLPQHDGKIRAEDLRLLAENFYGDPNQRHMTFPGMVYVSHPTEYGTLYTKKELTDISDVCRGYGMTLYLDGARLGYGLMSKAADLTLHDIASLCDVFYIGGTKVGALCGEAVVFTKNNMPPHFLTSVKRRGGLLAKGRLLGIQFDALFTDGLYFRIGRHGDEMAERVRDLLASNGITLFVDSPTNQQFAVIGNDRLEKIGREVRFDYWAKYDETRSVVRFATSWSTTDGDIGALEKALNM